MLNKMKKTVIGIILILIAVVIFIYTFTARAALCGTWTYSEVERYHDKTETRNVTEKFSLWGNYESATTTTIVYEPTDDGYMREIGLTGTTKVGKYKVDGDRHEVEINPVRGDSEKYKFKVRGDEPGDEDGNSVFIINNRYSLYSRDGMISSQLVLRMLSVLLAIIGAFQILAAIVGDYAKSREGKLLLAGIEFFVVAAATILFAYFFMGKIALVLAGILAIILAIIGCALLKEWLPNKKRNAVK